MLSTKAKAMQTLYRLGKISIEGLEKAKNDKIITEAEYLTIISTSV